MCIFVINKNIKQMKKIIFLLIIAAITVSCSNGELKKLKEENAKLKVLTTAKDSVLNDFFSSFDQIETNLSMVKSKQTLIAENARQNPEVKQDARERINDDIKIINDLMEKNKSTIASLKKKLKNSDMKIKKLEDMIVRLEQQLKDRDADVEKLKEQLKTMNFTVETLNASIDTLKKTTEAKEKVISQKNDELNTAYYAMGTEKELKTNKVITKTGGFIGIGRNQKVQENFNSDYFTKIDITKVTTININAKKAKLLTNHPSTSYRLEGTEKTVDKLIISNPKEFWKVSKYLVIVVN